VGTGHARGRRLPAAPVVRVIGWWQSDLVAGALIRVRNPRLPTDYQSLSV